VFPVGYKLPFGWQVRTVDMEEVIGGFNKRGQRGRS